MRKDTRANKSECQCQQKIPAETQQIVKDIFKKHDMDQNIDLSNTNSLLLGILKILDSRSGEKAESDGKGFQEAMSKGTSSLRKRLRQTEDQVDFNWQRGLKGNIIVSSPNIPDKNLKTIIKNQEDLGDESFTDHILTLVEEHYGVRVPTCDIAAIHPLKSPGNVVLKIWNRKPNSAWMRLVSAIKRGGVKRADNGSKSSERKDDNSGGERGGSGRERGGSGEGSNNGRRANLFLTFQMSRRRGALISALKKMKREKKIHKFSSNENGDIFFQKTSSKDKVRVTLDWKTEGSMTMSLEELEKSVNIG